MNRGRKRIVEKEVIVKKSNIVLRSCCNFNSIWQGRILALFCSKIDDKNNQCSCIIPVREVINNCELDEVGSEQYLQIARATQNLLSRVITIKKDGEKGSWTKYTLFSKAKYEKERNELIMEIHPDIRYLFVNLKEKYNLYYLADYYKLRTVYSQQLFEFLISYKNIKEPICVSLDTLHRILGLIGEDALSDASGAVSGVVLEEEQVTDKKFYLDNFREFKRCILEPSVKQINENTNLTCSYELKRTGRSYSHVIFTVCDKEQLKKEKKKNDTVWTVTKNGIEKRLERDAYLDFVFTKYADKLTLREKDLIYTGYMEKDWETSKTDELVKEIKMALMKLENLELKSKLEEIEQGKSLEK